MPYVSDRRKPPESMVQLTVLVALMEYEAWSGERLTLTRDLIESLPEFFEDDVGSIVRWLPGSPFNEREDERPGSLYNTLLVVGAEGVRHRHRKLMPTMHERVFHGVGAGDDLGVVELAGGARVGGLICWENRMPLARWRVYEGGPQIWLAPTADDSDGWIASMRHIAIEAGAFVVSVPQYIPARAFPDDFPLALPPGTDVFGRGGVWVLQPPYLLFYPDANGDDVPDGDPVVHLEGFGIEDSHSVTNNLRFGPDGWLYATQGSTVTGNIKRPGDKTVVHSEGQLVWRYHPELKKYEIFAEGGGNAFGLKYAGRRSAAGCGEGVRRHQGERQK